MDNGRASLYHIYPKGNNENQKKFDAIGGGRNYALPFLQVAYDSKITMKKAICLCAFILQLIDKSNIDVNIGGKPCFYIFPDKKDPINNT
jgi:20S proteasome alpha/beta subunit